MGGEKNAGWDLASDVVVLTASSSAASSSSSSAAEDDEQQRSSTIDCFRDLEELQLIRVEGVDKEGRRVVRIVGKYLPASITDNERLQRYVVLKLAQFEQERFAIVYFHTTVQRDENSPGIKALRQIYDAIPAQVKQNLELVYFVHPGLRSRLLFATLGRFFLSDGLYWKLQYISRIEFLRDHVKEGQLEIPEFVAEHDEELENNPLIDYGICSDPLQNELKIDNVRYPSSRPFF